ncbi:MAG: DUF4296 domain-containing protein [Bacteroidetes bacterium]|nr:DUF4296 domain-containing protein [Bacteroidota bacterium]
MPRYNLLLFSVLLLVAACSGPGTPKGVLDQKTMTGVLTDLQIVDGSLYSVMQAPDSLFKYGHGRYTALFKKYHTDTGQFMKSLRYYCARPDLLQNIYVSVGDRLNKKNDSLVKVNQKQVEMENKKRGAENKNIQPAARPITPVPQLQPLRPDYKRLQHLKTHHRDTSK